MLTTKQNERCFVLIHFNLLITVLHIFGTNTTFATHLSQEIIDMLRILFPLICILFCAEIHAQRGIIVVDLDTHNAVQGVTITDNFKNKVTTDKNGFVMLPAGADSITFSHVQYAKEKLCITEIADTMFLLPNEHHLPEVTAWAPNPELSASMLNEIYKEVGLLVPPRAMIQFDLFKLLDFRGKRDAKHLERAQEVLERWEKKKVE